MENNINLNNNNSSIDSSIEEKKKKKLFIKIIVFLSISFVLLLTTLINISRIVMFSNIFGSFIGNVKALGLVIYLISTILFFGYYLALTIILILYKYKFNKDWYPLVLKLDNKLDLLSFIAKCFSLLLFLLIFVATPCVVVGSSMYPTFEDGDAIIASNLFYVPKKGDVVIFDSHDYQSTGFNNDDSHSFYIKRVIATKDDVLTFDYENNLFYVNDENISNFSNTISIESADDCWYSILKSINNITNTYTDMELDTATTITVPKGYLLVFGDNRTNSLDSRVFGVISTKSVFGKAIFRLFPFNKFGSF